MPSVSLATDITDQNTILDNVAGNAGVNIVQTSNISEYVGIIVKVALVLISTIFLILMVYAGLLWMTAQGEEEKIKKSQKTIIMASLGLLVIVSSYAITSFVFSGLDTGTNNPSPDATYDKLGCCLDQLRVPPEDAWEVSYAYWVWKVVTDGECYTIGNNANNPMDNLYGPGTYEFHEGLDAKACEAKWDGKQSFDR